MNISKQYNANLKETRLLKAEIHRPTSELAESVERLRIKDAEIETVRRRAEEIVKKYGGEFDSNRIS